MTRKDYIKIADTIIDCIKYSTSESNKEYYKDRMIINFCAMLKNDNVKFNQERFIVYINNRLNK